MTSSTLSARGGASSNSEQALPSPNPVGSNTITNTTTTTTGGVAVDINSQSKPLENLELSSRSMNRLRRSLCSGWNFIVAPILTFILLTYILTPEYQREIVS